MKRKSLYDIGLKTGDMLKDKDGLTYMYLGYRVSSTGNADHHFIRVDLLPAPDQQYWTYNAVYYDTLCRRFPELEKKLKNIHKKC